MCCILAAIRLLLVEVENLVSCFRPHMTVNDCHWKLYGMHGLLVWSSINWSWKVISYRVIFVNHVDHIVLPHKTPSERTLPCGIICAQWWTHSEWAIHGVAVTQGASRLLWRDSQACRLQENSGTTLTVTYFLFATRVCFLHLDESKTTFGGSTCGIFWVRTKHWAHKTQQLRRRCYHGSGVTVSSWKWNWWSRIVCVINSFMIFGSTIVGLFSCKRRTV